MFSMINCVLVFVYPDDISELEDEYMIHICWVLERLLQRLLILPGQIKMDPEKVNMVLNWPASTDRKQLRCYLGFANFYQRFNRSYSQITSPLHAHTPPRI